MKTKINLYIAALAAVLVGLPLAEKASAQSTGDIVGTSISAAFAITEAALSAS